MYSKVLMVSMFFYSLTHAAAYDPQNLVELVSIVRGIERCDAKMIHQASKLSPNETAHLVKLLLEENIVKKPLYTDHDSLCCIAISSQTKHVVTAKENCFFNAYRVTKGGLVSKLTGNHNAEEYPTIIGWIAWLDPFMDRCPKITFCEDEDYVEIADTHPDSSSGYSQSFKRGWSLLTLSSDLEMINSGRVKKIEKALKTKAAPYVPKVSITPTELGQNMYDVNGSFIRTLPVTDVTRECIAPECSDLVVLYSAQNKRIDFYPFAQKSIEQIENNNMTLQQAVALVNYAQYIRGNMSFGDKAKFVIQDRKNALQTIAQIKGTPFDALAQDILADNS